MSLAGAQRVIVVGGGPCAAVAARELVRAGVTVTMLDAGRRAPRGVIIKVAGRTIVRWVEPGFESVNRQRRAVDPETEWRSSLSAGGLTNYWTGAAPRFHPRDFDEGAAVDERYAWPLAYDDLTEYYDLCERDLHLTAGDGFASAPAGHRSHEHTPRADWAGVIAAAREHGDEMGPIPLARGRPWMVAARAREFTSYHSITRRLRSPRFDVVQGARVLRVHPHEHGVTVEYLAPTGDVVRTTGHAVVLAAGALDTTEILLRSVSGDVPAGVGNTHGLVGRYLHDHPKEWWPATIDRPLTALHHPLYVAREPYGSSPPLEATSLTIGLSRGRERAHTLWNGKLGAIGVQVFGTMTPTADIGVTLDGDATSNDPASLLAIELDFGEGTRRLMDRARTRLVDVMASAGIEATPGPGHHLAPGASNHFGGTARMHADERWGVVDGWNRVHGAPDVLVCDASCFTTTPEKNPTLTAMAIAARAARQLAADLEGR